MAVVNRVSKEYIEKIKEWNLASKYGQIEDELNPIFIFSGVKTSLLKKLLSGEIDPVQLIIFELKLRELNKRS